MEVAGAPSAPSTTSPASARTTYSVDPISSTTPAKSPASAAVASVNATSLRSPWLRPVASRSTAGSGEGRSGSSGSKGPLHAVSEATSIAVVAIPGPAYLTRPNLTQHPRPTRELRGLCPDLGSLTDVRGAADA